MPMALKPCRYAKHFVLWAVRTFGTFPEESHPKIEYPVALLAKAKPEASKFLDFLLTPEAAAKFEAQGFSILVGK